MSTGVPKALIQGNMVYDNTIFMDKCGCLENAVADSSNELVFNNKSNLH